MQFFDPTTLLLVNAVFNLLAALAWALLAGVFRVAPKACWLLAAAHLTRIFALRCYDCRLASPLQAWPWLPELFAVLTIGLLCLGIRRLLRLRFVWGDLVTLAALGASLVLGLGLLGQTRWMLVSGSLAMALMVLSACRDILVGARPTMAGPWLVPLSLPYVALAVTLFWRGVRGWVEPEPTVPALTIWLWLLLSLASSVSLIALILHRLITRITQLSLHDPLTGTLNRRAITRRLQRLQALSQRGHPFCLVLIDIDHFKAINDQHGHAGGDAALVHIVRELRQALRDQDELGRLGGEEFCVLLPHTGLAAAAEVAERLRARLEARPCPWKGGWIALSASLGVAQARPDQLRSEAVLVQADQQLYRAKAGGRNQVCVEGLGEHDEAGHEPQVSLPQEDGAA